MWQKATFYKSATFAAFVVGSSLALVTGVQAAPITYNVDLTVGGPAISAQNTIAGMGSVVGSITTDGTIGGFTNTASITNWNLTLTDPAGTAMINPSNSSVFFSPFGSSLSATATDLIFNQNTSGTAFQFNPLSGPNTAFGSSPPQLVFRSSGGTGPNALGTNGMAEMLQRNY